MHHPGKEKQKAKNDVDQEIFSCSILQKDCDWRQADRQDDEDDVVHFESPILPRKERILAVLSLLFVLVPMKQMRLASAHDS